MQPHPFLDQPNPLAIAHRGGTESAPENTVAAFRSAVDLGFDHLETDVHLTSDGVLVAFHDDRLDRVTDRAGAVAELPWSEVRLARIGGTEPIPTLDDLLEEFPEVRFNIDAKSDHSVVALVRAIRRHDALHRVCLASFSDARLRRLRDLLGDGACTAAGPREITALVSASKLRPTSQKSGAAGAVSTGGPAETGPAGSSYRCLQVPVRHRKVEIVTQQFVGAAHARGRAVHVWTIDDPTEMHRLLDLGVDGIMTDHPSVLRSVLQERGSWQ